MEQAAKAPFCEAGSLGIWEAGVGGALLKKITKGLYKQEIFLFVIIIVVSLSCCIVSKGLNVCS